MPDLNRKDTQTDITDEVVNFMKFRIGNSDVDDYRHDAACYRIKNGWYDGSVRADLLPIHCDLSAGAVGSWGNAWGFGSRTKVGCSVPDGKQITIPCAGHQNVTLTIDVSTTTLTAVVQ